MQWHVPLSIAAEVRGNAGGWAGLPGVVGVPCHDWHGHTLVAAPAQVVLRLFRDLPDAQVCGWVGSLAVLPNLPAAAQLKQHGPLHVPVQHCVTGAG